MARRPQLAIIIMIFNRSLASHSFRGIYPFRPSIRSGSPFPRKEYRLLSFISIDSRADSSNSQAIRKLSTSASDLIFKLPGECNGRYFLPTPHRRPEPFSSTASSLSSSRIVPDGVSVGRGMITVDDEDYVQPHGLSVSVLEETVRSIRSVLGYPHFDVYLLLTDDRTIREINLDSRGVDGPTDILSFPFAEATAAGVLPTPEFDIPEYYSLGDMIVSVPYVAARMEEDKSLAGVDDVRGVSHAMSTEFNLERRIRMLLVHGILHLVGYDHIEDRDYNIMVAKEEEILKELGLLNEGR
mmetsp:Transcript_42052/g.82474  ORF Transcript_42052/g.82474 Transcript_42052/m.82474 type:complete len:298 (-) Transcript_42052:107-1000(-)